jgi:hypothetical protein
MVEIPSLTKGQVLLYIEENLSEGEFYTVSTANPLCQIAILQEEHDDKPEQD